MNRNIFMLLSFFVLGLTGCSPKEEAVTPNVVKPPVETMMTISGEAFYRERMAVPPEAQVEILLEDISRADAPAIIIGSQQIPNAGQPPYQFSIDYLPSAITPGHRYSLRARLSVNGELLFITDQANLVFVEGRENQTKLLMHRVASPTSETPAAEATNELINTYWKLITLNGEEIAVSQHQREPHVVLSSDMRVKGSDGCNTIAGGYTLDGNQISFVQMVATRMACLENGDQAQAFNMALSSISSYQIQGNTLDFLDNSGALTARFIAVALH